MLNWSRRKKQLEELLADVFKGHIQYHVTRYGRNFSHALARAWITFDQQELVNFSTIEWWTEHWHLRSQLQVNNQCTNYLDSDQQEKYYDTYDQARELLYKQGQFTRDDFDEAVELYLNLSIEKALESENPLIRMLTMLDRRVGKRKLTATLIQTNETKLVQKFYDLRCQLEGIAPRNVVTE